VAPVWRAMASATLGLTEAPGKIALTCSRRIVRVRASTSRADGWAWVVWDGITARATCGSCGRSSRTRRGRSRACAGRRGRGAGTRRSRGRGRAALPGRRRRCARGLPWRRGRRGSAHRGSRRPAPARCEFVTGTAAAAHSTAPERAAENYGPRIATGPDARTRKERNPLHQSLPTGRGQAGGDPPLKFHSVTQPGSGRPSGRPLRAGRREIAADAVGMISSEPPAAPQPGSARGVSKDRRGTRWGDGRGTGARRRHHRWLQSAGARVRRGVAGAVQ
jgi:hypothetical protein